MASSLTIVIPSNRALAAARPSIESALRFATERGHHLVISDNARDPAKADWLAGLQGPLTVINDAPTDAAANMLAAFSAATTDFVMPMGDDDLIAVAPHHSQPEWSAFPADVAAVKPIITIMNDEGNAVSQSVFGIEQAEPASRIAAYAAVFGGNNASYYSAWRRSVIQPIVALFCNHHPTKAGTADWPIVLAGLAEGRMVMDSSAGFSYAIGPWAEQGRIEQARRALLVRAGLPEGAARLMPLFHHCDCHVYASRASSGMSGAQRLAAIRASAVIFLRPLARFAHLEPALYPETAGLLAPFIEALSRPEPDVTVLFKMATAMLERLKPGLKDGYDRFLDAARNDAAIG